MMSDTDLSPAEIVEIFGGEVAPVETDSDELEVNLVLRGLRECLLAAAKEDGIGVNQLASRLDISPSSVSRFFSGDGDVHVSTLVLYGRALGRTWDCTLRKDSACVTSGNYNGTTTTSTAVSGQSATSNVLLSINPTDSYKMLGYIELAKCVAT